MEVRIIYMHQCASRSGHKYCRTALVTYSKTKIKYMKQFAMAGIAALLMAGFYALGSTSSYHSTKTAQSIICSASVMDTVPQKKDTINKRMPKDTTGRKDTLQRRDLPK